MAYKITKYKGKTKIKDTKTGKSAEIDIEKFMNGGYKTISEYNLGGEEDCPEGDFDCIERKRLMKLREVAVDNTRVANPQMFRDPMTATTPTLPLSELSVNTPAEGAENQDSPLVDETNVANSRPKVEPVSTLQPKGLAPLDSYSEITAPDISGELASKAAEVGGETSTQGRTEVDYTIPNLYGGVDIPTAAFTLGQSIKSKNTLGTVASSLKLLTGLGRNVVSGLGHQNRYNQVMKDYYEKQKNSANPVQYFAYGGKKDEELATGEYMHGISDEEMEQYNAEIEKGEYFQSNQGDIAEVVGKKHSQGGEKIQMEPEDRVLSDKLKLGGKAAKMLASKYDLNLKAKHTYSDVLDKFRRKMKLDNLIDEEADIMKKIGEQENVEDTTTRNFNLQVLAEKQNEIKKQKHPIEEQRKVVFDELFNMQEESKTGKGHNSKFTDGGKIKGKGPVKTTKTSRDLTEEEVAQQMVIENQKDIFDPNQVAFTEEGVKTLFAGEDVNQTPIPELNFGKYEGLNYFNAKYNTISNQYDISPTKRNPGNAAKYKDYLAYLQKQNPKVKINRRGHANGYLPFGKRLEHGGMLGQLANEYNIPLERAQQLVQEFSKGGKIVPQYQDGEGQCPEGYIKNDKGECVSINNQGPAFTFMDNTFLDDSELGLTDKQSETTTGTGPAGSRIANFGFQTSEEQKRLAQLQRNFPREFNNTFKKNKDGIFEIIPGKDGVLTGRVQEMQRGIDQNYQNLIDEIAPTLPEDQREEFINQITQRRFEESGKRARAFDDNVGLFTSTRTNVQLPFANPADLKKITDLGITSRAELFGPDGQLRDDVKGLDLGDDTLATLDRVKDLKSNFLLGEVNNTTVPTIDPETGVELPASDTVITEEDDVRLAGMMPFLFPDESPLPPSALQGTIKIEPRYDRERAYEIDAEPYLQDIKDREEAQVQSLEGLSPNVRAAVLANMRANSQKAESDTRMNIDTKNLLNAQQVENRNAMIQRREDDRVNQERLMYEMRQYRAQANTDNDIRNYFNKLQELNAQRFEDIHNLNLSNAQDESIYFDGQRFRRKQGQTNQDLMRKILRRLEE